MEQVSSAVEFYANNILRNFPDKIANSERKLQILKMHATFSNAYLVAFNQNIENTDNIHDIVTIGIPSR